MGRKDDASRPPSSRVAGRDGRIESRDAFVAAGDAWCAPHDTSFAAGDASFAASEAFIAANDASFVAREAFVAPNDASFVAREAFVAADDALFVGDEAFIAAGDALFAANEAFVAAGDALFAANEAFVAARDASFVADEAFVAARDASFVAREAFLAAREAFLAAGDAFLATRDAFFAARDAFLVNRFERTTSIVELSVQKTKSIQKSYVAFKLPSVVAALIVYVQGILAAMTSNTHFPSPAPALAAIAAALSALQQAEVAAQTRAKGTVVVRNDRRGALVTLLQQLRGYVQTIADADVENSAAIIQSSGFPLRKAPVHKSRIAAVKPGAMSGSVEVVAPTAGRRAAYEWQYSLDGGKTWVEASPSLQAKQTVVGLPVGTTVQFRYRAVVKTGPLDWSQPLALLVR